jgi:Ulp1 family protease
MTNLVYAEPRFMFNPAFVFLTKDESTSHPWLRLMSDPTIHCSSDYGIINVQQLQQLKPGYELNDEVVNAYLSLCQNQSSIDKLKTITSFFWPQVIATQKTGYKEVTKILFRTMVSVFIILSKPIIIIISF